MFLNIPFECELTGFFPGSYKMGVALLLVLVAGVQPLLSPPGVSVTVLGVRYLNITALKVTY